MRALATSLVLALTLALGAVADDAEDARGARFAFQRGQNEYNLGNYTEAVRQFEEAYRLKPLPALLFNIAQCYRFIGNLEKAVQTYRSYLRNAAPDDKNVKRASELLEQVEAVLASKRKAEQSPPHGLAQGGGQQEPAQPPAVVAPPVNPAPSVKPPAPPAPAPEQAVTRQAPPRTEPRRRVYTWVAAGASALAFAGGAYFGAQSSSALSQLSTGYHARSEIDSQSASAKSDASKANVLLAAGAALAVTAGVLFVLQF
jgi:tetratricopeptide (TPR) repeat protein